MTTQAPARYMQGIAVPAESVRPGEFFQRTRRHITSEGTRTYAGLGASDIFELKKSDILSGLTLRLVGSVTITPGTGSVNTTARWPLDLPKRIKFTANGQSNIINCSGAKLKVREFAAAGELTDRGIVQQIAGASVQQGTLSKACESWGIGNRATAVPAGTYNFDLEWYIPVAEDGVDLAGAIFAATSSTDLTVTVEYANTSDLFVLAGNATATVAATVSLQATKFSIPLGADGQIVVPDLSLFHSMIEFRQSGGLAGGENEVRLVGQGAGKTLLRVIYQLWNGSTPAPLPMTAANFGRQAWRYAGNETPDEFVDGSALRIFNERTYGTDIGGQHGFGVHEFAAENAFRDTVDMGTSSELRLVIGVQSGVSLTNPAVEVVAETIFAAGAGA